MSNDKEQDKSQQTEQPTPHKIDQAFKRGQVAVSREIIHWFVLGGAGLAIFILFPYLLKRGRDWLMYYILSPHALVVDAQSIVGIFADIMIRFLLIILPIICFFLILSVFGHLSQTRLSVSKDALQPKLSRLSIQSGIKKIFSVRNLIEFVKGLVKLGVICVVLYMLFKVDFLKLAFWGNLEVYQFLPLLSWWIMKALFLVLVILFVIAALDYFYQRFDWLKKLRMTKEEVKKENKDLEGDPRIKQKIRQLGSERVRQNFNVSVPRATVVITNPTHFAVALEYEDTHMDAPIVCAKGANFAAKRIREIAEAHKIPIVENPPLARALYKNVDLKQEIPPEHYKAVAEIIRFVMSLKKKRF